MSGGVRTFKLAGGGYADVPEEKMDEWMRRMDQRGIQFSTADVSADMQVGEPEVIKTPREEMTTVDLSNDPIEHPPSMVDRFLETGADTVRGGLRGLFAGFGDKAEAGLRSALPGGGSYADEFAKQNSYQDEAAARSPYAYNIAKTLGGAPWDLGAAVIGAPGGLAGEVASSAALGQLRGAGMSRKPTLEGVTEDAAAGAADGGLWGLGGGMAGRFLSAGSDALTGLAPRARATAMGEVGPAARAQLKTKGEEFVDNLPQAADELGMTPEVPMDWRHPIDSLKQKLTFKSPGDYADEAGRLMDDVHGPARGQAVADATAQGVSAPRQALIDDMDSAVAGQPRNYKRDPYAFAMERNMGDVPPGAASPGAPPQLTASQLDELKHGWEAGGFKGPDEIQTSLEAIPARASRDAASAARGQLHGAIDEMALPETADAFHTANDAYGQAASIKNMAGAKALDLRTQNPFSLPNVGRTLGGVAGGASLGGSVAGIPGMVVGGGLGYVGQKAAQQYGPDVMADFLRSGGSPMHPSTPQLPFGAPGGGMRDAAIGGTLGSAVGGAPGAMVGGALGLAGRPGVQGGAAAGNAVYGARDRGGDPGAEAQREIESGRGYMLSDVAMDALQNEPQVLGRYAPQFAQAMGSNEADAVSALITRLSHTDPDFRVNVLPALRARTGGM